MAIGDDFEIQASGNIRHISGTSTYTVLELHRWLQDLADGSAFSGDDTMDVTYLNPSSRATDKIIYLLNGYNIGDTEAQYLYGGSITQLDGTEQYSGLQVLGSVYSATTLQIVQNNTLLTPYWGTGLNNSGQTLLRILVKTRTANADIDGKRVRVQARTWGDFYDFFNVTLGEGESVAAISTLNDAQNTDTTATVSAYAVTNTEGFQTIDLLDGSGDQPYYSQWNYGAEVSKLKATYQYAKYIQRTSSTETIHGIDGELFLGITHSYAYDTETGTAFVEDDIITWDDGTIEGTGLLLALDATNNVAYIQLLTGEAPVDGQTITNEATTGTHDLNSGSIQRPVSRVFLGSYTGTLIGAFGVGVLPANLTAFDEITDLNGNTHNPPISVNFALSGLKSDSEVRIYKTSDDSEIDGTESSSTSFTYNYQWTSDISIYLVIFHLNYKPIRLAGLTLGNENQTIPIQQIPDRVYNNP